MSGDGGAWFRWSYYHPSEAEDPRAAFAAGVRYGKRLMLEASADWSQLTPLLGAVLEELAAMNEARAVESDIVASDTRSI